MTINFFTSAMATCMHPEFSSKHSKSGAKKQISIKHMQTFSYSGPNKKKIVSIINQHLEQQVSEMPWLIELYMTKCKNSSIKCDPSTSLYLNRNQPMIKNVITTSSQQQVLMQSLWKASNKRSIKRLKITIQNKISETKINIH